MLIEAFEDGRKTAHQFIKENKDITKRDIITLLTSMNLKSDFSKGFLKGVEEMNAY